MEPAAFNIDLSFRILFMVIIGGVGSIMGSLPRRRLHRAAADLAEPCLPHWLGSLPTAVASNLELMVFGALIIFFLIVEPHGLARLWQIGKEKLRLWPFPH